ncbi:hypothetical protein SAMN05444008_11972 [Cnuella takakiae]|uniref:Uncharacterized protein n=1 Tax=Cnuella takakiae TaxID=1302690 RepID=A0A1M5HIK6_9BACT|nr:hypothetical protein [Cnuella takakiae]SHG15799.1 hypothetical protein SAMN05444008_11972 [Cnuella takakiae]
MKRYRLVFGLLASTVFLSCKTPAQTVSPNSLKAVEGQLFLDNGDTVTGKISMNQEVLIAPDIQVAGENGSQQFHLMDVKGYAANGEVYELKHTENHIHPRSGFYFMKRLTPDGAAMHLYEHLERKQKSKSPMDVAYQPVYYVQLPGEKLDRVYASFSKALVPHFHQKMAGYIKDCPALQQQVKQKQKGFFYSRMDATEAQRKEVLLRIIESYNNCK